METFTHVITNANSSKLIEDILEFVDDVLETFKQPGFKAGTTGDLTMGLIIEFFQLYKEDNTVSNYKVSHRLDVPTDNNVLTISFRQSHCCNVTKIVIIH